MKRAVLLTLMVVCATSADAGVVTAEQNGVRATLYAPDWVWKGQNLNFLVVLENASDRPVSPTLSMAVPNAEVDEFGPASSGSAAGELAPGIVRRAAFANIATSAAIVDKTYSFVVTIDDATQSGSWPELTLSNDVKVIRGAVVSEGIWAAILPAAVAAAWCVVLALYFSRHAATGAWKTSSAPVWTSD